MGFLIVVFISIIALGAVAGGLTGFTGEMK